jgi:hypothetical protein
MGAPAISTRAPARKPRPKPRPAAKPRQKARTAAKPRPAARSSAAAKPRARAATRPRTATRTRPRAAVPARRLTPVAAVGGIADSGFVMGLTRSRLWIGLLAALLGGIVAINVWGLGLSSGSSAIAAKIDELQRESSVLRGRNAVSNSNDRIAAAAGELGLRVPPPDGVSYVDAGANDAQRAAERLANGKIEVAPPPLPATEEEPLAEEAVVDPAAVAPVEPVTTEAAPIDPTTGLPVTTEVAPIDPNTGLPVTP